MYNADFHQVFIHFLDHLFKRRKRRRELFFKKQKEYAERGKPRQKGWNTHYRKIFSKADSANGGKVNVRRITDNERHTPSVRRDELADEIRHGTNFFFFAKMANEGGESQNHDIVGSEYG